MLHGVDVSGSAYLTREGVLAAADFAARAHAGQTRRTGDPYIMHCVETACIMEGLLSTLEMEEAENDERWVSWLPCLVCNFQHNAYCSLQL